MKKLSMAYPISRRFAAIALVAAAALAACDRLQGEKRRSLHRAQAGIGPVDDLQL